MEEKQQVILPEPAMERSPSALPAESGVSGGFFWSAVYWIVRVPMIVLQIGWEPPWRWANRL